MSVRFTPDADVESEEHARRVRGMFARIACRYDLLNHLLSGNTDARWRKMVARRLGDSLTPGARVLDVACGTGDLAFALAEASPHARVVGVDFCRPMLALASGKSARRKGRAVAFVEGDALRLPFAESTFDAASIAFGLRNLARVERGLEELLRVLKPGGRVAVLEFSKPVVPGFSVLFNFYFTRVLPFVGGVVSGSRGAYEYLPRSVSKFPDQRALAEMMRRAGFERVEFRNLTGGIAALHTGARPQSETSRVMTG